MSVEAPIDAPAVPQPPSSSRRDHTKGPTSGQVVSCDVLKSVIMSNLRMNSRADIHIGDRDYFAYSLEDLKGFLKRDVTDQHLYKPECFDCDDFSYVTLGREKEWFGTTATLESKHNKCGSTFGVVWGDIRYTEDETESNPHSVNFFVDEKLELWLIEPQSDQMWKPTRNSTFWMTIC